MEERTNAELTKAAQMITRIAKLHGVSEDAIRADLLEAMRAAQGNSDPLVQEKWKTLHYSGIEPTVEEFLAWVISQSRIIGNTCK